MAASKMPVMLPDTPMANPRLESSASHTIGEGPTPSAIGLQASPASVLLLGGHSTLAESGLRKGRDTRTQVGELLHQRSEVLSNEMRSSELEGLSASRWSVNKVAEPTQRNESTLTLGEYNCFRPTQPVLKDFAQRITEIREYEEEKQARQKKGQVWLG